MKKLALIIVVAAAAGVIALLVSRAATSSGRPALSRVSTHGTSVRVGGHDGRLIATRDGQAFYRYDSCYAVGPADRIGTLGGEACIAAGSFPSSGHPLLDMSVYESTSRDRNADMTLFRIEGFAADGVDAIGVLNRAGKVGLRVPVTDNVYALSHMPPGLTGSIVPLDADGTALVPGTK
jgi:hypothetical protein